MNKPKDAVQATTAVDNEGNRELFVVCKDGSLWYRFNISDWECWVVGEQK